MDNEKEISFGAFDSELMHQEIFIPEGFEATIDGDKIILTRKDSEDERIRKELIGYIVKEVGLYPGEDRKEHKWLRWLEKQGEQKLPIEKFHGGEWVVFNDKHESVYQIEKIENFQYTLRHILGGSMPLSFSGEDMIRPWAIQDARDGDVLACNEEILLFKSYSVQGRISLYCWYNGQTNNFHSKEVVDTLMTTRNKIYPATKEQRDLLFQKMKEAGYTFDFEKKELKKISQRMISAEAKEAMYGQPAWSEEDKTKIKSIIALLKSPALCAMDGNKCIIDENIKYLKSFRDKVQPKQEWSEEDMKEALRTEYEKGRADAFAQIQKKWSNKEKLMLNDIIEATERSNIFMEDYQRELIDWLKSIKERYFWKPETWEIQILESVIEKGENPKNYSATLHSILEQLKKLKE